MGCAMSFEVTIRTIPQQPDNLASILEKFKKSDHLLLKRIMAALADYDNGLTADNTNIEYALLMRKPGKEREVFEQAYVDHMGLAFYHQKSQNTEAAWHYYAKAQNYLGVCDTWDLVVKHLLLLDLERQNKAKAAKLKAEKTNLDLKEELIRVIKEKKPPQGWMSNKELMAAALPEVEKICNGRAGKSYPLFENLEKAMRLWLGCDIEVGRAYRETASPSNEDAIWC